MERRITVQHISKFPRTLPALRIVFFAALIAIPGARSAYTKQAPAPSAEEIIRKAISAYASCASYMDVGRVQTIFISERGRITEVKPFSTSFVRPGAFRFEFQSRRGEQEWDRYIVWRDGDAEILVDNKA